MTIWQQFKLGAIYPFEAWRHLNRNASIPLVIYALAATLVFSAFSWFVVSHEQTFKQLLFDYLLPQSWHDLSHTIVTFFFESQTKIVLAGVIINGAIVLASICLFPVKEWCSKKFEHSLNSHTETQKDFPLWLQGIEEIKLLLLYITAQSIILAIGYYPYLWSTYLANTLSIGFLFYSFGLDFIAPALQRRRIKYTMIIKLLSKHSCATLCFGALFSIPILLLSQYLFNQTQMSLVQISVILFFVNIFLFTMAIPAGTYIAWTLLPILATTSQPSVKNKNLAYGLSACILSMGLFFHFTVTSSIHHKSQLLKCNYQIDWSSMSTQLPELQSLFSGQENIIVSFSMNVENPTPFDVKIENSQLTFWHKDKEVSQTQLNEFAVNSQSSNQIPMKVEIALNADNIALFSGISEGWSAQLEFDLLPGIPFVIQVI